MIIEILFISAGLSALGLVLFGTGIHAELTVPESKGSTVGFVGLLLFIASMAGSYYAYSSLNAPLSARAQLEILLAD